jgi:hypothetical protein
MEEATLSKIRIALAGLGVSALLLGGVMEPAMAAKAKSKTHVHKTQVIKQKAGNGGNAKAGNGGSGGAGGSSGSVAVNNAGGPGPCVAIPVAPFIVCGPGGAVGSGAGGGGGAGGAGGAAGGGAGGGNVNGGSNTDATTNSGNSAAAG